MRRRSALKWLSAALTAANGLLVGIPTLAFLRRMAAGSSAPAPRRFRLARLDDLPPGVPVRVPVKAEVRDAWTAFPDRTIGAVWLVRETGKDAPPESSRVRALSATCPHLACQVDDPTWWVEVVGQEYEPGLPVRRPIRRA